jgi:hypothetical protein
LGDVMRCADRHHPRLAGHGQVMLLSHRRHFFPPFLPPFLPSTAPRRASTLEGIVTKFAGRAGCRRIAVIGEFSCCRSASSGSTARSSEASCRTSGFRTTGFFSTAWDSPKLRVRFKARSFPFYSP